MRFAVIDVGSNTVKLNIYKVRHGKPEETDAYTERTALGAYKTGGVISAEGVAVLSNCMAGFARICKKSRIKRVFAFATQSLRGIANADEVIEAVKEASGFAIRIIPGEEEARLGFKNFIDVNGGGLAGVLLDMGGGSSEITEFEDDRVIFSVSLPFGALSTAKLCGADIIPDAEQTETIRREVEAKLAEAGADIDRRVMYGTGGTVSGALKLCRKLGYCKNDAIKISKLRAFCDDAGKDKERFCAAAKELLPERYDSVFCGVCAIIALCDRLGCEKLIRSKSTCRAAYAAEIIEKGLL